MRCADPTCRAPIEPVRGPLTLRQDADEWTLCGADCLIRFLRLSALRWRHHDRVHKSVTKGGIA